MGVAMIDSVRRLAGEIGGRRAGSDGERRAAVWIEQRMRQLPVDVSVQEFRTSRWPELIHVLAWICGMLAALILVPHNVMQGVLLGAAAAWVAWREEEEFRPLSGPFSRVSRNIIGRIAPSGPVAHRLVVTAHYDTARSGPQFNPRVALWYRPLILSTWVALFGAPVMAILGVGWSPFGWVALLLGGYIVVPVAMQLYRLLACPAVAGGNDNASGVAVLLELAERFSAQPLERTELFLVASGAQESGRAGMARLLDARGREWESAAFINLDSLGRGDVKYTVGEGILRLHPADTELVEIAYSVAIELGLDVGPWMYRTGATDATCAMARGQRAISVVAVSEGGVVPSWHWPDDIADAVDPACLDTANRLVNGIIQAVDNNWKAGLFSR